MHQTSMPLERTTAIWRSFQYQDDNSNLRKRKLSPENKHETMPKKKNSEKRYRRHAKPPYSYVGLIALAIQSSPNKQLKLSEILARISTMFPFFKGEYQGWRDSVRHNLSQNKCFKKVLPDPKRPQSKGNYWTVNINEIPAEKLKRQNTPVARNVAPGFSYARDLTDIFDLKTGTLKTSQDQNNLHTISAICGGSFAQNSPESCVSDELENLLDGTHDERYNYTYNEPPTITNRQMSPDMNNLVNVSSPMSSTASSTPSTPLSTSSDKQSGMIHYNNGGTCLPSTSTNQIRREKSPSNEMKEDESPPPNVAPFGGGVKKTDSIPSERPTPPSTPEQTNIDYSFGPIGPPNVNLTSCDDLSKINQPKPNNMFDQYDFIKEQSEILSGRNKCYNMQSYSTSHPPCYAPSILPTYTNLPHCQPTNCYNILPTPSPPNPYLPANTVLHPTNSFLRSPFINNSNIFKQNFYS